MGAAVNTCSELVCANCGARIQDMCPCDFLYGRGWTVVRADPVPLPMRCEDCGKTLHRGSMGNGWYALISPERCDDLRNRQYHCEKNRKKHFPKGHVPVPALHKIHGAGTSCWCGYEIPKYRLVIVPWEGKGS